MPQSGGPKRIQIDPVAVGAAVALGANHGLQGRPAPPGSNHAGDLALWRIFYGEQGGERGCRWSRPLFPMVYSS